MTVLDEAWLKEKPPRMPGEALRLGGFWDISKITKGFASFSRKNIFSPGGGFLIAGGITNPRSVRKIGRGYGLVPDRIRGVTIFVSVFVPPLAFTLFGVPIP
jgi:hypothetical protein